jgi:hypothetical protein
MTRSKIAISLPKDQLVRVAAKFEPDGPIRFRVTLLAPLADYERRESLRVLLRDLIERYGERAAEDVKWAERARAPRRG